ncbi:general odorant-binding protein 72-like [Maniola hyperantus]|uniref:general odorant-binding protein 72-like n=1 Tax=Aphantopus hyperantus TaxID=2795564 RepID=UPI00156A1791|nr:general odorant-binding protein 72-like [Maniola hyperantus]
MIRLYIFLCIFCITNINFTFGMSREQLKKTLTIMKNQCMLKNGVTNNEVGEIEKGVFLEDRTVMCYIACIYKTIQVVRNDRLDKDLILRQIDILYPKDIKEAVKKSVIKCVPVQNLYEDPCEGIFYAARCLYADDPSNFIFP